MITANLLFKIKNAYNDSALDPVVSDPAFNKTFNNFCSMMNALDEEKQNVLLFLLTDYIRMGMTDYSNNLFNVFSDINNSLEDGSRICFLPLVQTINNSSKFLSYFAKLPSFKQIFSNKKITSDFSDVDISELVKKINAGKIDYCIFLDDFIGTGDTAEFYINQFTEAGLSPQKMVIASLVIQKDGLNKLKKICHKIFFAKLALKGISDNDKLSTQEKEDFLKIMGDVEDIINIKNGHKYRFGYKKSEALVTMMRTPNNTFPIFWKPSGKKNEGGIIAPFPR